MKSKEDAEQGSPFIEAGVWDRMLRGDNRPFWKLRWWIAMRLIGHNPRGTVVINTGSPR